jgi:parallel beta-helix repeat protein
MSEKQTITRRRLLAAMGGMAGAAVAATGLMGGGGIALGSGGLTVTEGVYGEQCCDGLCEGWHNVKQYGAFGDGVQDDTAAIQAALDAAHAAGGGTVLFPPGVYRISNVTCYDDLHLKGAGGATLKPAKTARGIVVDNTRYVLIEGLRFDCSLQTSSVSAKETCVTGTNAQHILIRECELFGGIYGIWLYEAKNGCIERCHGHHFNQWPFAVTGCQGFQYLNNVSHDNGNDGLKFAGVNTTSGPNLMKDMIVANNLCYNNARDGFDLAGNNVENLHIYGNIFRDNTLQGIDCKIVYQGQYMKNVVIRNNFLLNNQTGQINCQNDIAGVQSAVSVYDNMIRSAAASPVYNYIYGIRLDGQGQGSDVYHNDIRGCYFGIRLHDSDQAVVSRNTVDVKHTGIFVDLQTAPGMDGNRIEGNDIETEVSHCIHIKNAATTNTLVRNNSMSTGANVYRIADTATGTVMYGNEFGHASVQPSGRAVRGEIVRSSDPVMTNCMGWIATNTAEQAIFAPFGAI